MPGRSSEGDKRQAAYLKTHQIERRTGICAVCYRVIPNDTHGGSGAARHYPGPCCNFGGTLKDSK